MNINEIIIEEIDSGYPFDLLYDADPHQAAVKEYIDRGHCYVALYENQIIGEYVLLRTRPFTAEIMNISVKEKYRRHGVATMLIRHAVEISRNADIKVLDIGTANPGMDQMRLYQKCGFVIDHIDKDFFTLHYPEPIVENGILCRDMVRMKMLLI